MSDLPSTIRLQQNSSRPRSGEDLEVLGKTAAAGYCQNEYRTLSEAVVETVKKAGLSPEQVRRVVEFANTDAYLQEFRKEGQHKVVEFQGGPADFSDVIKDLNDGGGGTVFDSGSSSQDYNLPPPDVFKTAQANAHRLGLEEVKLAEAFGVEDRPLPYADPFQDIINIKEKLSATYGTLMADVSSLENEFADVGDRLFYEVKQASLGGLELGQLIAAWSTVTDEPEFMKAAFTQLTPRLLSNGVFPSKDAIGDSLMKTASVGIVNPQHPLVQSFSDYCNTAVKLAEHRLAAEEVAEHLDQVSTFCKQADARSAGEVVGKGIRGLGALIGKGWGASKGLADVAARGAEGMAAGAGASHGVEKGIGWAIRHLPHAAVALSGNEVLDRAKYNPTLQSVKGAILSRTPYTTPWYSRQAELANRMYY